MPGKIISYILLTISLMVSILLTLRVDAQSVSAGYFTQSVESRDPDRAERVRLFEQVWRSVNENYYDPKFNGVDWRSQREIYRPLVESANTRAELYSILRRMLGTLGDAHTRVYSPEESFDRYRPSGTSIGLLVRPVEGRPVVTWVEPDSEAAKAGIRPGYRLEQIDGQPVEKVLNRIRHELVSSSTSTALEMQSFDRLFQGEQGKVVSLRLLDESGRTRSVDLARRVVEYQRRVIARTLPHRFGYIELTGFGQEIEHDFEMAMQQMMETRGLVIDLRNNGGGFVTSVMQVASYFFGEETDLGEFISRQGLTTKRFSGRARQVYNGPVIVLVSSRSASGAEIFAAAMQERHRAVIVGTHKSTCGCLLGVSRTIKLLDGGKLNISDTDFRTATGRRIEGHGVQPELIVELKANDLLLSSDRPLDVASDYLGRQVIFGNRHREIDFSLILPTFTSPMTAARESATTEERTADNHK